MIVDIPHHNYLILYQEKPHHDEPSCVIVIEAIDDYVFSYRFMQLPQYIIHFLQEHTNLTTTTKITECKSKKTIHPDLYICLSDDIDSYKSYPSYFSMLAQTYTL